MNFLLLILYQKRKTKPALNYQDEIEYVYSDTDSEKEAPAVVVPKQNTKKSKRKKLDEYEEDLVQYDLYPDQPKTVTSVQPSTSAFANLTIAALTNKQTPVKKQKSSQPITKSILKKKDSKEPNVRSNPKRNCTTSK